MEVQNNGTLGIVVRIIDESTIGRRQRFLLFYCALLTSQTVFIAKKETNYEEKKELIDARVLNTDRGTQRLSSIRINRKGGEGTVTRSAGGGSGG